MTELTTSAFLWGDRHFPPALVAQQAQQLAASDAVDYMSHSTQLGSFISRQLWTSENAPLAGMIAAFIEDVLAKTTRTHAETGYLWGTPEQVASKLAEYVQAGITFVVPADYLPVVGDPADAARATERSIECLGVSKAVCESQAAASAA